MSDIVERLRDYDIGMIEAADEVERILARIESAEQAYVRLDASMNRLKAAFRVNMLRAFPHMSHDEIDAEIEAAIRESGE